MPSLACIWRPQTFEECCGQSSIIKILKRQIETNTFVNCYLFSGPTGCGKTTLARIFANKINGGQGEPIEVDAASNNGVDNVRALIDEAKTRALDCEYKVIIVDEAHQITNAGWNVFLKCIEEPPKHTMFIFCTTESQKIPSTIMNRLMIFNLSKIDTQQIKDRLLYICQQENYNNYNDACDYISKISNGGMRDAISLLDKCVGYSTDLTISNVLECLGDFSYDLYFDLFNSIISNDEANVIGIIEYTHNKGKDLKLLIENFTSFVLDVFKFKTFNNFNMIKIPEIYESNLKSISINKESLSSLLDKLLELKSMIKYDSNYKNTIEIVLLQCVRG